jgi:uncharacterized membrane protein
MSLEMSKVLGLIGAIFMVVSPLSSSSNGALGFIGLVLLLIAFKDLAEYYRDGSIYKNALNGIIIFVVGVIITAAIIGIAAAGALTQIGLSMSNWTDPVAWQGIDWNNLNYNALAPYFAAMIGALVILFVLTVLAAYFIRKSLRTLAQRTGISLFATSGTILLVGAILTIILVGFILLWVAMVLLAIAFYRMRTEPPIPVTSPIVQNP